MKTLIRIKITRLLIALFAGMLIFSCSNDEEIDAPKSELILKNGSITPAPGDLLDVAKCDLIAGQSINVGNVIYSNDGVNLYVIYNTSGNWLLTELHLYAGSLSGLPTNNGGVKIGLFPYSASNLNTNTYTFTISINDLSKNADGSIIIAAHAVVTNGIQEETAFSNCSYQFNPLITLKSKFTNGKYACTDGDPLVYDWNCIRLEANYYTKDDEYNLIFDATETKIGGKVTVTDDGTNLIVTVIPGDDPEHPGTALQLNESSLYIGAVDGLLAYAPNLGCIQAWTFPYQKYLADANPNHTFMIPLSSINYTSPVQNSISFSGNRWGWYSYYNF